MFAASANMDAIFITEFQLKEDKSNNAASLFYTNSVDLAETTVVGTVALTTYGETYQSPS